MRVTQWYGEGSPYKRENNGDYQHLVNRISEILEEEIQKDPQLGEADFGSIFSYPQAGKVFERPYKFSIGRTTIQRTTQSIGKLAEVFLEEKLNVEKTPNKEQPCPYLWPAKKTRK